MSLFTNNPTPPSPKGSGTLKPKSIFDKNPLGAPKSDIRERFMKMSDKTTVEHIMGSSEKSRLAEDLFLHSGDHISRQEVKNKIQELSRLKSMAKNSSERAGLQDKIDFLGELGKM